MATRSPGARRGKHAAHPFLWDDTTMSRTELLRVRGMLPGPPPPVAMPHRRGDGHRPVRLTRHHRRAA